MAAYRGRRNATKDAEEGYFMESNPLTIKDGKLPKVITYKEDDHLLPLYDMTTLDGHRHVQQACLHTGICVLG